MSKTSEKKCFGYYVTIVASVLCLAAGIYYKAVNGYFGLAQSSHKECFDALAFWLLIGGGAAGIGLTLLNKAGLASAVAAAASGVAALVFVHKCYWYVVDVMYGIDEKAFDPKFFTFVGLTLAAFLIGEIAIYLKKTKKA